MFGFKRKKSDWIAYVSTYPPRECGIATFTKDLTAAIDKRYSPRVRSKIIAMNDNVTSFYRYPAEVIFEIMESDIQSYVDAAKKINKKKNIRLVSIQHEFGIFGGKYGSYLVHFLKELKKPVVITFHSMLPGPNEQLKRVVQKIAENSDCFVVMNRNAIDILRNDYGLDKQEIEYIPHGIPPCSFKPTDEDKAYLGFRGRIILSSFGMLGPGKGYEYVIESLPKIIEKYPNVTYIIIGETHPHVRDREGERYRNSLKKRIKKLGLENHVKFYGRYQTLSEIIKFLHATDIYICANSDPNQVTSGTLAYALGCGKAVVSTPFLHAKEMLESGRGILAEFSNPDSFAKAVVSIVSDYKLKAKMEETAYSYTRGMIWSNVSLSYMNLFKRYAEMPHAYRKTHAIKLDHLIRLTDDFGIIQFANKAIPDKKSGYTVDDNARALVACSMYLEKLGRDSVLELIQVYLDFIESVQDKDGRFFNFVDMNRKVDYAHWSEDAHGRTMWALGHLVSNTKVPEDLRKRAQELFMKGLKQAEGMKSPRAAAFTIQGLYFYNLALPSKSNRDIIKSLAGHLVSIYNDNLSRDWNWFEQYLTYANGKLPEALFYAYLATKEKAYLKTAESSLEFLTSITYRKGLFCPIGHDGWYIRGSHRAHFDQQPIETSSMVQCFTLALKVTKKKKYKTKAKTTFAWFLGKNRLNQTIYNDSTGGCHDGLGSEAINLNQGAESTLVYLIARLSLS